MILTGKRGIVAALVAGYALFMVVQAPAWLLTSHAESASRGTVRVSQVQGSLWRGTARVDLVPQGLSLAQVSWHFQPQGLLAGEVRYAFGVRDVALRADGQFGRGFSGLAFHDTKLDTTAATLARLIPAAAVFAPDGNVTANIRTLTCKSSMCSGSLEATWQAAALALAELRPLGDYTATATLKDGNADFEVKTLAGALRFAGRGTFQPPRRLTFNGEASAAADVQPRVSGLMKLLGTPDERGTVKIRLGER